MKPSLFTFSIIALFLFFITGVLPALNFDDDVKMVVEEINATSELDYESLQNKFKEQKGLSIKKINENVVFEFKKPGYVFLYVNSEAEKQYQANLPKKILIKFV